MQLSAKSEIDFLFLFFGDGKSAGQFNYVAPALKRNFSAVFRLKSRSQSEWKFVSTALKFGILSSVCCLLSLARARAGS